MSNAPEKASSSAFATNFSFFVSSTGSETGSAVTEGKSTEVLETVVGEVPGKGKFSCFFAAGKGIALVELGKGTVGKAGVERVAVAALPLANEGIGNACPATSIAASSSSTTARRTSLFASGFAINPVIALWYRLTSPSEPVVEAIARSLRIRIGSASVESFFCSSSEIEGLFPLESPDESGKPRY